jgi:hypothetical protein
LAGACGAGCTAPAARTSRVPVPAAPRPAVVAALPARSAVVPAPSRAVRTTVAVAEAPPARAVLARPAVVAPVSGYASLLPVADACAAGT